jgi:hypothetical protein
LREAQTSPLRYPGFPVEVGGVGNIMRLSLRKGAYAVLSGAAWQEIRARSLENISTKDPRNCRSLGFARDDKGEGDGAIKNGCWTEAFFIASGGPMTSSVEMTILL